MKLFICQGTLFKSLFQTIPIGNTNRLPNHLTVSKFIMAVTHGIYFVVLPSPFPISNISYYNFNVSFHSYQAT